MDLDEIRHAIGAAFDLRATAYDESRMHRALAAAVADFTDLDGVESVLDVATGTGLVLRALSARQPGLRMTGIDLSAGMLQVARERLPETEWIQGDAAALPVADAAVDLVTCVTALHIIPDTAAAIAEWARVLRPGGRALTATFAGAGDVIGHVHQPGDHAPTYPRVHAPFASAEALAHTVAPAGFAVGRHTIWTHEEDEVLIAELSLSASPGRA